MINAIKLIAAKENKVKSNPKSADSLGNQNNGNSAINADIGNAIELETVFIKLLVRIDPSSLAWNSTLVINCDDGETGVGN